MAGVDELSAKDKKANSEQESAVSERFSEKQENSLRQATDNASVLLFNSTIQEDFLGKKNIQSLNKGKSDLLNSMSLEIIDNKKKQPNEQENSRSRENKAAVLRQLAFSGDSGKMQILPDKGGLRAVPETEIEAEAKTESRKALESMKKVEAYQSPAAALISIANDLADNSNLRKLVTNTDGQITKSSIDAILKVEAGDRIRAAEADRPGPVELNRDEKKTLDSVRTHLDLAFSIGKQGLELALDSAAIAGMNTNQITKKLIEKATNKQDLNVKTLEDALKDFKESVSTNYEQFVKPSKAESRGGRAAAHEKSVKTNDTPAEDSTLSEKQRQYELDKATQESKAEVKSDKKPEDPTEIKSKKTDSQTQSDKPVLITDLPVRKANDVSRLQDREFAEAAKRVLTKIDKDGSGKVTKEELSKALEDPSITGQEAQALAAMYQNFDKLRNISNHEGWFETDSIAPGDLDKYHEIQAAQAQRTNEAYQMKAWAHAHMNKFDKDGGGSLSWSEIENALNDASTSKEDKRVLEMVKKHYSNLGRFYESGVSLKALDDFAANVHNDTAEAKLVSGIHSTTYHVSSGQTRDINRDLYADKNNPLKSINPDAIRQGSIGDCYFLAALGALAKSNPQLIKDSIKDNGDGTFTVTFPGAKDEPITIKAPTEAEQGLYNHGSPHGLWASVMEKAYGEYCQKHFWRRGPFNLGGGNTPTEGADGGGRPESAMRLLTGNSTDTDMLIVTSQATTAAKLEKAFSSNPPKSVTAGIAGLFSNTTEDNFYTRHAYSIIGFTPDGKGGGTVTIRNPWGIGNGTGGTTTISLEKFIKNFSDISYEQ